jgi:hypothetical protein
MRRLAVTIVADKPMALAGRRVGVVKKTRNPVINRIGCVVEMSQKR